MIKWIVLGIVIWIVMAVLAAFVACFRQVREYHSPYSVNEDSMAEAFAMALCLWWALFPIWGLQVVFEKAVIVMSAIATKVSKDKNWL